MRRMVMDKKKYFNQSVQLCRGIDIDYNWKNVISFIGIFGEGRIEFFLIPYTNLKLVFRLFT